MLVACRIGNIKTTLKLKYINNNKLFGHVLLFQKATFFNIKNVNSWVGPFRVIVIVLTRLYSQRFLYCLITRHIYNRLVSLPNILYEDNTTQTKLPGALPQLFFLNFIVLGC